MADPKTGDGLWRWIVGGVLAGAVVLGLLVAAYAIGYNRGQDHPSKAASGETTPSSTETGTTETTQTGLVARGEALWTSTGCASCHTITGPASVGPTVKGLAGSTVELGDGQTVTADDAYLSRSITDPDGQVVKGFDAGLMSAAVASQKFDTRTSDVEALVAYMKAQR